MKVSPLAFDSFGIRSMCTLVSAGNKNILIDPGVMVTPRREGLPPSGTELRVLDVIKNKIVSVSKEADFVVVSHYHYDHYFPSFEQDYAKIYRNKTILCKDRRSKCNFNQRKRGKKFELDVKQLAKELIFCDGKKIERNGIKFIFSPPMWHGSSGSVEGYVLFTGIEWNKKKFLHCPDTRGPIDETNTKYIIKFNPDFLILDGPVVEEKSVNYSPAKFEKAEQNVIKILKESKVKTIILDHSSIGSLNFKEKLKNIYDVAEKLGKKVLTAAEFAGRPNVLLEAKRKLLWEREKEF